MLRYRERERERHDGVRGKSQKRAPVESPADARNLDPAAREGARVGDVKGGRDTFQMRILALEMQFLNK